MKEIVFKKESSYSLRGICMLMIVVHHIFQYTASRYGIDYPLSLSIVLQSLGYLGTAVFFLLSGYGLTLSLKRKEPLTAKNAITLMLKLYKPFLLIWVISSVVDVILLKELDVGTVLSNAVTMSLTEGGTFWFLKEIFFIYLFILIVFSFIRKDSNRKWLISLGIIIFVVIGKMMGMGDHWLNSVLCFPLGMWCYYHKEICEKLNTNRTGILIALMFVITFAGRFCVGEVIPCGEEWIAAIKLVLQILSAVTFALYSIRFVSLVNVKNTVLSFIGTNSLCVYLYHLYFLSLFSFIGAIWLYLLIALFCTWLLTAFYIKLDNCIMVRK